MAKRLAKAKRAPVRGKRMSVRKEAEPVHTAARKKSAQADDSAPHPQPLPTTRRARGGRGEQAPIGAAKPKAAKPDAKPKGGPVAGTPSPMRTKLSAELQDYARRKFEQTADAVSDIAIDCGVDESVIRRMALREFWVRFVAPPRDLPPVAKLMMEVEALERAAVMRHPEELAEGEPRRTTAADTEAVALRGSQVLAPQGDGVSAAQAASQNITRFIGVVMAHLDEFEAVRRAGKLIAREHLPTARAISTLTEAFNKLQRLRAAQPGQTHDNIYDRYDMPADLDAYRLDLTRQIEQFLESRFAAGVDGDVAAQPVEGV